MKKQPEQGSGEPAPLTASREELLVGGSDETFRRLVHGLFSFLSLHTSIRNGYAELLGLPGAQYTILLCIRHLSARGSVKVGKVASHLRQSGSFITVETNKLEQMGLITKERDDADRRSVSLRLTSLGRELLDSIAPLRRQVNDVQFGCLDAEEFLTLASLVDRLTESGENALSLLTLIKSQARPKSAMTPSEATAEEVRE